MRVFRFFLLHLQSILYHRSRSFVWFMLAVYNPGVIMLYWWAAFQSHAVILNVSFGEMISYYLLLIICTSTLWCHAGEDVSRRDIQQGFLVSYLLRPFSYYWWKCAEEIPWRFLQGFYGLLFLLVVNYFLGGVVHVSSNPLYLILIPIVLINAFFISFTFDMIVGMTAFWLIDNFFLFDFIEILFLVFAGTIMPLAFFPAWLQTIAQFTPFPFMIYYPVRVLQGVVTQPELNHIILLQCVWLAILISLYNIVWDRGLKKFTSLGQ